MHFFVKNTYLEKIVSHRDKSEYGNNFLENAIKFFELMKWLYFTRVFFTFFSEIHSGHRMIFPSDFWFEIWRRVYSS